MGRAWRLVVVAVVLLALGLWGLLRQRAASRGEVSMAESTPTFHRGAAARKPSLALGEARPTPSSPAPPATPAPGGDAISTYLHSSRYPPHSRPLSRDRVDLIHWNARHERPRPSRHDARGSYLFSADRYWVQEGDRVTVELRGWIDGRPSRPEAIETRVEVLGDAQRDDPEGAEAALTLVPDAQGWGGVLDTTALAAAEGPVRLRVRARFRLAGLAVDEAAFDLVYNPASSIPARFDGRFADRVVDGSLQIDVGIVVEEPGHYVIDANLYDADEEPVAWSRFKGELGEGPVTVTLELFGKALTDAAGRAPYHLGELRGWLYLPGHEPDLAMMPPYEGTFETQPHPLAVFADEPWDSPHKQAKLDRLRAIAARGDGPLVVRALPLK